VGTLQPGDALGELALLHPTSFTATAVAATDTTGWFLPRDLYRVLILSYVSPADRLLKLLAPHPMFAQFKSAENGRLAKCLAPRAFKKGETLIRDGDNVVHIIAAGTVSVPQGSTSLPAGKLDGASSRRLTLRAGDMIATGRPADVGLVKAAQALLEDVEAKDLSVIDAVTAWHHSIGNALGVRKNSKPQRLAARVTDSKNERIGVCKSLTDMGHARLGIFRLAHSVFSGHFST